MIIVPQLRERDNTHSVQPSFCKLMLWAGPPPYLADAAKPHGQCPTPLCGFGLWGGGRAILARLRMQLRRGSPSRRQIPLCGRPASRPSGDCPSRLMRPAGAMAHALRGAPVHFMDGRPRAHSFPLRSPRLASAPAGAPGTLSGRTTLSAPLVPRIRSRQSSFFFWAPHRQSGSRSLPNAVRPFRQLIL
jgi:hypothetical protein